jgi:hypothetical protein
MFFAVLSQEVPQDRYVVVHQAVLEENQDIVHYMYKIIGIVYILYLTKTFFFLADSGRFCKVIKDFFPDFLAKISFLF